MITCPQCGTSYVMFQPSCNKCGGPLQAEALVPPAPAANALFPPAPAAGTLSPPAPAAELPMPPPAPRSIASGYILRLLFTDAGWISGCILIFIGLIFSVVGAVLTQDASIILFGLIFLLPGLVMLGIGGMLLYKCFRRAHQVVGVLRDGEPTSGRITELRMNYSVSVNGIHPWIIGYTYSVNGENYTGKVSTMIPPGQRLQQGREVWILYQADDPQVGTIYPHP
ncbi:MAG: hypothetical protein ACYCZF_13285 [Anaerolineae bacterium]